RGLERILRVMPPAQNATTNAEDHRSVPPHQRLKCRLVAVGQEPLQKLGVVRAGARLTQRSTAKMANNPARLNGGHATRLSHGAPATPWNSTRREFRASVFFFQVKECEMLPRHPLRSTSVGESRERLGAGLGLGRGLGAGAAEGQADGLSRTLSLTPKPGPNLNLHLSHTPVAWAACPSGWPRLLGASLTRVAAAPNEILQKSG